MGKPDGHLALKIYVDKPLRLPHYWICPECAADRGGTWPEGHVATCSFDTCPYCKSNLGTVAPIADYDWPDRDLSAGRD